MRRKWMKAPWARYGFAAVTTLVAVVTTAIFRDLLLPGVFQIALLSVAFTAWVAGFGPSVVMVLGSAVGIHYFAIAPLNAFGTSWHDVPALLTFTVVALLLGGLTVSVRKNTERGQEQALAIERQNEQLQQQASELEEQLQESQSLQEELEQVNRSLATLNAQLERQRQFLEQAQRSAHVGSWEWIIPSNEVHWSDELFYVYGLEPGAVQVSFESFLALVHPDDRALVQAHVQRAYERKESFGFDHRIIRPDGQVRWLNGRGRVLLDDSGAVVRMIGSGQDITELRALAEEKSRLLEEAAAARIEAETANRAKTDFLAAMSHELRTPLNAIGGYVELLEMGLHGPLTVQQQDDLARMRRAQSHLLSLVDEVLSFARLEAGRLRFHCTTVRVHDVLARMEDLIRPQLDARQIRYTYDGCAESVCISVDRERLEQIVLNLLANAVKFTGDGGRVELAVTEEDGQVAIGVSDTGPGIPPEKREVIFEPFVQLGNLRERTTGGIGLGLAISRDLARAMGGDVTVASEPGAGSTFTVRFARAESVPDAEMAGGTLSDAAST